ncbi:hypothetical protein B4589_009840 [Halolamina sp. CBA1230]|uniref:hypothetical protein n=1 Tax=Halolamina sp. CBA1230 TaxID=1853690 RepID=UPI0009A13A40|nr:hypothetical protein [Halolamina sp. CBA1230]QKY20665.1 hypothetical protein B4589_009840 [Halolamina sp. CBA1230]
MSVENVRGGDDGVGRERDPDELAEARHDPDMAVYDYTDQTVVRLPPCEPGPQQGAVVFEFERDGGEWVFDHVVVLRRRGWRGSWTSVAPSIQPAHEYEGQALLHVGNGMGFDARDLEDKQRERREKNQQGEEEQSVVERTEQSGLEEF